MLIKCPECGNAVSDEAYACPFCGYPIKEKIGVITVEPKTNEKYSEEEIRQFAKEAKEYSSSSSSCGAVGAFMFLGGLLALILGFVLTFDDEAVKLVLIVLGGIIGDIGFLVLVIGTSVNNTKCGNRIKIIEDYKKRHPDFKEE